jgi:protoporphyrinogen oxidase
MTIAVVGAGPAGLAAAWRAAHAGHKVVVLERAASVGGMAGSFDVEGIRVDHGSHRLHPATPAPLLAALRELMGDELQVRPRNGRIRLMDRWVAFPLQTGDLVRHMPRSFAVRAGRDALLGPLRRPRADTFAEVVRAGLGPAVLATFYGPYAHKLWGVGPDELAGDLARRRISASSPAAIVRRLARGHRPEGQTFLYPRRGFGAISEALADAGSAAGAELRLGVGVSRLEPISASTLDGREAGWSVHLDDGERLDADHVWSTMPLGALARMMPSAPAAVTAAAGALGHRAMVLLYVVVDQPRWTTFDAHYFPGLDIAASRLSEPCNYRTNPEDPADRTVLCAEIPCDVGDATWSASDDDLAERLADELAALGLPRVRPTTVTSRRLPRVYPVYRPGYQEHVATLERWASGLPGLLTFGRQGLFTPDNTHHAMAMGWAAADALATDGTFDTDAWTSARDGFNSFVVED